MKKKNIIVIGITSVIVIFVIIMGFYAMGNGRNFNYLGKYNKLNSEEGGTFRQERGSRGMMRGNNGSGNINKGMMGNGNTGSGNMMLNRENYSLSGIVIQELSIDEKNILSYGYSEELLAHDLYTHFYDLYKVENFKMIADSETQHIEAVKSLIDRYNLQTPTNYGVLQSKYDELKKEGEKGLKEALEVGMKVEKLDIDDISKNIKLTNNYDFKIIFTNIGGASYNHLRSFIKALQNNSFTTNLDYSKYLTNDDLNTRGPLNKKFYDKLIGEGVVLPVQVENRGMMR